MGTKLEFIVPKGMVGNESLEYFQEPIILDSKNQTKTDNIITDPKDTKTSFFLAARLTERTTAVVLGDEQILLASDGATVDIPLYLSFGTERPMFKVRVTNFHEITPNNP